MSGGGRRAFKVIVFDMDGTLIKEKSSWEKLHRHFGTLHEAEGALRDYVEGRISYEEFMRRDIACWPKPLHISEVERLLLDYELADGAVEVVRELKAMGMRVAIVSAGIDILANDVASKVGADAVLANGLAIDSNGYLTGEGIKRVDPLCKDKALEEAVEKLGAEPAETVAVGDTRFDASMLRRAGLGIALRGDEELEEVADVVIKELRELPLVVRRYLIR